ncbi:MAG: tripartite tricarboxylate transporter substrate binding protein [Betaproteobacteria bacterium]|nr:tripartite tricarboxylate transporter substrate binding protein [Pseudomonadota bacterium]NBP35193.1 tripartite tricarboxylate transporter substrate binding protein [Betaproteobacteria bacterium]HAB48409.1 tripartite tricarboxylate transporter substrate binding protein [Lautropia sp.]NBP37525.1 tripartite tricarboxylate transporter substrate binding protein [Betaproteobacteria bacterium]NBQ77537.1 tripartite tricarboxylate transporter substrate binding protein [Betaproteobacteria bacterium]
MFSNAWIVRGLQRFKNHLAGDKLRSVRLLSLTFAGALIIFGPRPVAAHDWGGKPIVIVQGFSAGSGIDVVIRQLQEPLEQALGTRLVMEYRPGAGSNIASAHVAQARPDGHTLLLGTAASHGINAALYKKLPFDVEADFTPVAPLVDVSNVLVINPSVIDAKDLKSFVEQVRAQPGKFNYASTGNGTGVHLAMAEFLARASLDMTHVPYKGGPEALQAVLKGEVCCIFNQVQTVLPQLKSERIRLLAVSTAKRVSAVAEVPTIAESGYPGYDSSIWFALFGPKQMDPAALKAINDAVRQVLSQPAIRERFASRGNQVRIESPEQFRQTVRQNRQRWAEVVKASGASID